MTPQAATEVTEFVITESIRLGRNIDWRLVVNAMGDRMQHAAGHSRHHWKELVMARLSETVTDGGSSLAGVARQINAKPIGYHEKVAEWKAQTGKSEATFKRQRK